MHDVIFSRGIVHLSKYVPNDHERSLVSKGLGFCPTAGAPDVGNIASDINEFRTKVRLHRFHSGREEQSAPTVHHAQPFQHRSLKSPHLIQ